MGKTREYLKVLGEGLDKTDQSFNMHIGEEDPENVHLSTGVILKVRHIAPRVIVQVIDQFKEPEVPILYDTEKEREIANPQAPEYLEAMNVYLGQRGYAVLDACIALGTELAYSPETIEAIDSENWIDELSMAGITFDGTRPRVRYTMWIRTVAAIREEDLIAISRQVLRKSGVTQEDVNSALNSFRSEETRDANSGHQAPKLDSNGNNV